MRWGISAMRRLRLQPRAGVNRRFPRGLLLSAAVGSRLLWMAAVGSGLLWICVLALAAAGVDGVPLLVLGCGGVLGTAAVVPLINHRAEMEGLSRTDPLTGLANHRGFDQALVRQLERARRQDSRLALVILDVGNFKAVNDALGHARGDEVLRSIGKSLRIAVNGTGTAARIGSEEFALIVPDRGANAAYRTAERAREAVSAVSVRDIELCCSAGVAVYPDDAQDALNLRQLAEGALHWAKRCGNDRTRRFDPGHVPLARTRRRAAEVTAVLDSARPITPVFQPVVALASGHLVGYEALARFPSQPKHSPEAWFAQAHDCGFGPDLEAAAIRAALEPVGRPLGAHLALNASPSALTSGPVVRALPRELTGIVIEITEHEFVSDDDHLAEIIAELRERGARIALDDAGAGYAGLTQVMRVRPDIVKLDRNLTKAIHADPARMVLVESFVRFAQRTGAIVCAEGIESLDDLAVLADLDVPWGQGYALARPARPWALVSPVAAEVCRASLAQALRTSPVGSGRIAAGDRRLEQLSARLACARSGKDIEGTLALIGEELQADTICLSRWRSDEQILETVAESSGTREERFSVSEYPLTARVLREQQAAQVLVGDPEADSHEVELLLSLGMRSVLIVPVVGRGETLGIVEAYSELERPWTRAQVNRARIISNQFGSVIQVVFGAERSGQSGPSRASPGTPAGSGRR
jgi:diguanylate cyclase (GGDEF)-like protein